MSATKISELNAANTISANDLIVVVSDPAGSPSTRKITANNFANSVSYLIPHASNAQVGVVKIGTGLSIDANGTVSSVYVVPTGPYADDAAANTAGIPINGLYYDSTGTVKIRLV